MKRAGAYPKDITKKCAGCGAEKVFHCENRYQKLALFFCTDQCAENYYFRTCKTDNAARSKIGLHYARKGMKWEPGKNYQRHETCHHHDRKADRILQQEREAREKMESNTFRAKLRALDAEYWQMVRRHYGLRVE